ncbi:hypothetical protein [Helicobacter sp. MIT 14-3879]|uniref:hypothetical protein n=1 Tax=Helicobacter sp. MIT 14-3879 TaxID=2040649 RepID=UPI000E1E961F|nr:hypothetical protein [Helicobacter sp. MIT 14-3879]RDU61486.1 hypothetical protein CQA44_08735 [Helicobacter sp. MIT 14-3879]
MNEAIQKAQYLLKAKIFYFLFSKLNILICLLCYFFATSLDSFFISYIALALFSYKFIFSQTRMDNPYKIFLLDAISKFIKNLRSN